MTDCVLGLIVRTKATAGGTFHANYWAYLAQAVLSVYTRRCIIKNIFLRVKLMQHIQAKVPHRHFQRWRCAQGLDGTSMLPSRYGGTFSYFENVKIVTTDQIHPSYQNWKLCRVSSMLTCLLPRCRGFSSLLKEGRPFCPPPGAHVSSWQGSFKGVKFSFFLLCPFRYTLMMKIR